jgi:hypothetical protein
VVTMDVHMPGWTASRPPRDHGRPSVPHRDHQRTGG